MANYSKERNLVKQSIFAAVPSYKDLKWPNNTSRVGVSYWSNGTGKHRAEIRLGVGLLTANAIEILDKVGDLTENRNRIIAELEKNFVVDEVSKVGDALDRKHRYYHAFRVQLYP